MNPDWTIAYVMLAFILGIALGRYLQWSEMRGTKEKKAADAEYESWFKRCLK